MRRSRHPPSAEGPFEIRINDLTHEGAGVARQADGKALFIADALPGELVRCRRTRRGRDFDQGQLLEVLESSPDRVKPPCPYFGVCGGCSLQHLDPAAQLQAKQRWLLDSLTRIGKLEPERVLSPLTGPAWGYRRRARLAVSRKQNGEGLRVGFHERDSLRVAAIDTCAVLEPALGQRLGQLGALVEGLSIRDQVAEIEWASGDANTALLLRVDHVPSNDDQARLADFSRQTGIWIWLRIIGTGRLQPLLPDTPELSYRLPGHDIEIRFAPDDFIQANREINCRMVDQALELLEPRPQDQVLELFSGVGNFSLPLARKVAKVVAVEGDASLVERARRNAELNGLGNIEHRHADLGTAGGDPAWLAQRYDAVLLDPPRTGAREILPRVARRKPRRILYISCNPGTLARDAGILAQGHGYRLRAAGIMDMFPHTSHVESMALFEAG